MTAYVVARLSVCKNGGRFSLPSGRFAADLRAKIADEKKPNVFCRGTCQDGAKGRARYDCFGENDGSGAPGP
jgi:hypothetical protein